jgi:hypothetical protein
VARATDASSASTSDPAAGTRSTKRGPGDAGTKNSIPNVR